MKCYIFSKETVIRETKKVSFANSNLEVVSHGERKQEKETNQNTGETCSASVYRPLYSTIFKKHALLRDLIAYKFRESTD